MPTLLVDAVVDKGTRRI